MNAEVQTKWVAALRSDDYKQGLTKLHQNVRGNAFHPTKQEKFCCMGVLCDLAYKEGIVRQNCEYGIYSYDDCESLPPHIVQDWAGITDSQCQVWATMNDFYKNTFQEIADNIEENQ